MDRPTIKRNRLILKSLKALRLILWIIAGICISIFIFYWLVWLEVFGPLPDKDELTKINNATATLVYSSDNHLIGKIFEENRSNVSFEEFPPNLINALIATEDARFYKHNGIDKISLLRVVIKSIILQDESSGGGSTITQQLAKNLYGRRSFGFMTMPVNKIKEMILAERIEEIYSKEQILELYLNTVSFSENVYGIEEGSRRFFGKHVSDLRTEESAVLVGILKANTYYNPRLNPSNSLGRRNLVLTLMHEHGYISKEERDSLQSMPIILTYQNLALDARAGYFVNEVEKEARKFLEEYEAETGENFDLKNDGLRIYTTLNYTMQKYAQRAMHKHLYDLQEKFNEHWEGLIPWEGNEDVFEYYLKRSRSYQNLIKKGYSEDSLEFYLNYKKPVVVFYKGKDTSMEMSIRDSVGYYMKMLNAAFFAMNPSNGAVMVYLGGLDYHYLPFNHVLAKRQSASTFKPILYVTALERGIDPCDYISNEKRTYPAYDNWSPGNYRNDYGGKYSMKGALKKSINVAAVKTVFKVGAGNVVAKARELGIENELPNSPSIALGTGSVSLQEMVQVYSAFASGGFKVKPYMIEKITTEDGIIIFENKQTKAPEQVIKNDNALLITEMLKAAVDEGTGYSLRSKYKLRNELAGKTGTAQNYTDGWFIGYNSKIVAGVWVGASSPAVHFRTGNYGSGSAMALPVFGEFFQQINTDSTLAHIGSAGLPDLNDDLKQKLDCPDFKENDLLMHRFFDLFKNEEGERIKEEKEDGFFERLFNRRD